MCHRNKMKAKFSFGSIWLSEPSPSTLVFFLSLWALLDSESSFSSSRLATKTPRNHSCQAESGSLSSSLPPPLGGSVWLDDRLSNVPARTSSPTHRALPLWLFNTSLSQTCIMCWTGLRTQIWKLHFQEPYNQRQQDVGQRAVLRMWEG